mmetsp:Transcript_25413/g.55564  ORF Transcript_25413/g.55564 Transcript_25413/m.55564 type:complete len:213 (-) Transcript_25413:25-663(-)
MRARTSAWDPRGEALAAQAVQAAVDAGVDAAVVRGDAAVARHRRRRGRRLGNPRRRALRLVGEGVLQLRVQVVDDNVVKRILEKGRQRRLHRRRERGGVAIPVGLLLAEQRAQHPRLQRRVMRRCVGAHRRRRRRNRRAAVHFRLLGGGGQLGREPRQVEVRQRKAVAQPRADFTHAVLRGHLLQQRLLRAWRAPPALRLRVARRRRRRELV